MAQEVSRRQLTTEALVRARISSCGICGVQSGTGTVLSPSSSAFPYQFHSTGPPYPYIIWGINKRRVAGRSSDIVSPHRHDQQEWVETVSLWNYGSLWAHCLSPDNT